MAHKLKKSTPIPFEVQQFSTSLSSDFELLLPDPCEPTKYKINHEIDSGGEARVNKGYNVKTGESVAVKIFKKIPKRLDKCSRERDVVFCIPKYPNIIEPLDWWETDTYLYVVYEYCDGRDLAKYLNKNYKHIGMDEKLDIFIQIKEGIEWMHQHHWIHRDIKLENIVRKYDDIEEKWIYKIIDFGYTYRHDPKSGEKKVCGTPQYVAPEIIQQQTYNGMKADSWSLGILLYSLMHGRFPFISPQKSVLFDMIKYDPYEIDEKLPKNIQDCIHQLLKKDPNERSLISELKIT